MSFLVSLLSGVLFGLGLAVSGMIDPSRVLSFLDLAGRWDPSLIFVLCGALIVALIGYRLSKRMSHPAFAQHFASPNATGIDARLISGAVIFGIGWGMAGFCPGPALASAALLHRGSMLFVAMMVLGMAVFRLVPDPAPAPSA